MPAIAPPVVCRCRFVRMQPGMTALTAIPLAAQRRLASTAKSMLAVLDWAWARNG